jgi:hypothetical protein
VYRLVVTPNGIQEVGQWETIKVDSKLLDLYLKREFAYSQGNIS